MIKQFPRTEVEGVSLPRLLIGSNWFAGFSHTGHAADMDIHATNDTPEKVAKIYQAFSDYGIDAVMGGTSGGITGDSIKCFEDMTGKKLIRIDTPGINVDDSKQARAEAEATIKNSAKSGATFCFPHHSSAEQLVNKNKRTIDRLPDYLSMIRDNGMIPGLSAHMPELIMYSDANGYDVQTYIQIFNCMGFLMQIEIESIIRIIHNAKKPVMTIKPMAAGRVTPYVGLTFNWNVLRPQDMITVGCKTHWEAYEDVEISFAALEGRLPDLEGRNSPNKTDIIK
ncbi:MAG: hypothetical protein FWG34_14600 [Oscillospiraceae bacterium]|jgi:hypothetical protein|nr:hypothetical protein [Oscillospiraceae bacterium]